jgi:tRNA(Ile)-lysidine synthase
VNATVAVGTALARVLAEVERTLAPDLDDPATHFLVGFSGGMDSTLLLAAILQRIEAARVRALYVDHGLHEESAQWADHCRAVGDALGVAVIVQAVRVPPQGNREARARRARYTVFARHLEPGERLLLAHHADDQAETLLWRLVRGRLPRGMPARRRLARGVLVRPLLRLTRSDLAAAAAELDSSWIEDPSNRELTYDRNYLRREILPRLRARWPDVVVRLGVQAERLAQQADAVRSRIDADAARWPAGVLPVAVLRNAVDRQVVVRRFLERAGCVGVSVRSLAELERQLAAGGVAAVGVQVASDAWLRGSPDGLRLHRRPEAVTFAPRSWDLAVPIEVGRMRLVARWTGTGAPPATVLDVRPRRGGETLRPSGRGGSRSVKRLLQEARIPRDLRRDYPLLYDDARLVLLPGVAVDAGAADRFATGRAAPVGFVVTVEEAG